MRIIHTPAQDISTALARSQSRNMKSDITALSPERTPTSHLAHVARRISEKAKMTENAILKALFPKSILPVESKMSSALTTATKTIPPAAIPVLPLSCHFDSGMNFSPNV